MAGDTSRENGKQGGRPPSKATLIAQKVREYIAVQVELSHGAIVAKAVTDAIAGDRYARDWLTDQGFGKPVQTINGELDVGFSLADLAKRRTMLAAEIAAIDAAEKEAKDDPHYMTPVTDEAPSNEPKEDDKKRKDTDDV